MDETFSVCEVTKNDFNILSFERKLIELIEELRLRRNMDAESEKTIKCIMEEKYATEAQKEEQQRKHFMEKEDLEQQIALLKRKLDDKICLSDDEKVKNQVINKSYSQELRILKEELRNSNSEKLNLHRKVQELEGKLKLHTNFQENIVNQVAEVRKSVLELTEDSKELVASQKNVLENVAEVKTIIKRFDICNQHLQQLISLEEKKTETLTQKLVESRAEFTMLRNSMKPMQEESVKFTDREKLQEKVLELEKLLLLSRKENEKTVHNFVKTNELLCKFMDKYTEVKDSEKSSAKEIERLRNEINGLNKALEDKTAEIKNHTTTETQTEGVSDGKEEISCFNSNMDVNFITPSMKMLSPEKTKIYSTSKFAFSDGLNKYVSKTLKEITKEHLPCLPDKFTTLEVREEITISEVTKRKHDMIEEDKKFPFISNENHCEPQTIRYTSDTVASKDAYIAIDADNSKENSRYVEDEKNEVKSLKDDDLKGDSVIKNYYELIRFNEHPNKTKENETDNENKNEQFRDISEENHTMLSSDKRD